MMKDKIKQRKILIIALAVILTLSVGYAIFSESLNIKGSASTGSTNFNIVFDRVGSIREVEASSTTAEIKENGKKLEINVPGLSMPTAYAIIPVTIKNKGEITAKVKEIRVEGLDTTDIKITYEGLAKEDIFNPNDEKEVNIKVIWDRSSTSTSVEASFSIEIVYEQVTGENITTSTGAPVTDSRFIYEGTKLMGLSAEGEEYFKQPGNKELIIPEGTTEIADGAFFVPYEYEGEVPNFELIGSLMSKCDVGFEEECTAEESQKYNEENQKFNTLVESNNMNQRLKGKTLNIPETVKKIGNFAFSGLLFEGNLIIPNSVISLGAGAFAASTFDGTLTLSQNLNKILSGTFYATMLEGQLIIPDSITEIEYRAFANTGFDTVVLSNSLNVIARDAFVASNLTGGLYIPDNVSKIDYGAFWECNNLTSVSIPTSTTYKETSSGNYNPSFPAGIQINKR